MLLLGERSLHYTIQQYQGSEGTRQNRPYPQQESPAKRTNPGLSSLGVLCWSRRAYLRDCYSDPMHSAFLHVAFLLMTLKRLCHRCYNE